MRLIYADALEARMYHDAFEVDSDMQRWDSGCWIRYKMFENAIREAPTIEERKKGKWINDERFLDFANCSECGYQMDVHAERGYFNFCPNCGTDMREKYVPEKNRNEQKNLPREFLLELR